MTKENNLSVGWVIALLAPVTFIFLECALDASGQRHLSLNAITSAGIKLWVSFQLEMDAINQLKAPVVLIEQQCL